MGYQIRITYSDGSTHLRKQVYKTKSGADRKADWLRTHLAPEVKVIYSRS